MIDPCAEFREHRTGLHPEGCPECRAEMIRWQRFAALIDQPTSARFPSSAAAIFRAVQADRRRRKLRQRLTLLTGCAAALAITFGLHSGDQLLEKREVVDVVARPADLDEPVPAIALAEVDGVARRWNRAIPRDLPTEVHGWPDVELTPPADTELVPETKILGSLRHQASSSFTPVAQTARTAYSKFWTDINRTVGRDSTTNP